jgi:hypothetical protein
VGFVANKVALGQFSFQYFGFLLPILIPSIAAHSSSSSSGAGTTGPLVADVPSALKSYPMPRIKEIAFWSFLRS